MYSAGSAYACAETRSRRFGGAGHVNTGTSMRWEAEVKIAGPVGAMGQRVLQPIINQQVGNVLGALEKQVSEAAAGSAEQQS